MPQIWEPRSIERDHWIEKTDPIEVKYLMTIYYEDVVAKVESILIPIHSNDTSEELIFLVRRFVRWVKQKLMRRGDSDDNEDESGVLSQYTGRVGHLLRSFRRVVCDDREIRGFVSKTSKLGTPEAQVIEILLLLIYNYDIPKVRFYRLRGHLELAVLLVRTGLDKFLDCSQKG